MVFFGVIIVLLLAAGALYQFVGAIRSARTYPPPGRMVDVGGHCLHVVCAGSGLPAVLFESGIAASSLSWTGVLGEVATFTRACAYDRAGLAWSEMPNSPLTPTRLLDELRGWLVNEGIAGPYIFVGHSFGAFLVCVYASQHPDETACLVLLDPPTEWHQATREQGRLLWGGMQLSRIGGMLARVGVVRACLALMTGGAPGIPRNFVRIFGSTAVRTLERLIGEVRKLPAEVHPVVQALWCQPKCFRAMANHLGVLEETAAVMREVTSLPDVPLVIISSGDQAPETIAAHRELARLSVQGRHLVAARSGHWIQFDEPELIVETIREIVDHTRRSNAA